MSRLQVDWPACEAHGLCAEVLPERVQLDDWGYPVVTDEVPEDLLRLAKAAVKACPVSALRLRR